MRPERPVIFSGWTLRQAAARAACRLLLAPPLGLLLFLPLLPSARAAPAPKAAAQAAYSAGERCLAQRDLTCALQQARLARTSDPGFVAARVLLARVILEAGNAPGAEELLDEALKLGMPRADVALPLARSLLLQGKHQALLKDPRCSPQGLAAPLQMALLLLRAQAASERGDGPAALIALAEAQTAQPDSAAPWLAEVPVQLRLRKTAAARTAVDRALALAPGSADAEYRLATVLQAQGETPAALAALGRALAAQADHVEARLARAGLLLEAARADAAAADLIELQRLAPGDPRAAYLRALLAERRGDSAAVQTALREVVATLDAQPEAHIRYQPQLLLLAGMAHHGLGQGARAQKYLETYRQTQGDNAALKLLAQVYLKQRQPEQSVALMESYLRAQPTDGQALSLLASAHLALGRNARAVAFMQEALRAQDTAEFHTALGVSLLRAGETTQAISALQTALKRDPKQLQAGQLLVELQLRAGQIPAAQKLSAELVQRNPTQARLHLLQGEVAARAGDLAAARRSVEKAVQLAPELGAAQLGLARLDEASQAWEPARTRLEALLKQDESALDAMLELALLAERRGQPAEAQRWLETAAGKAGPQELRPLLALLNLHLRAGRFADAQAVGKRLLEKAPDDYLALMAASQAHLVAGDAASARRLLLSAGRLAGAQADTRGLVARMQQAAGDAGGALASAGQVLKEQPDQSEMLALSAELQLGMGDLEQADRLARRVATLKPRQGQGYTLQSQVAQARGKPAQALELARRAHQLDANGATLLRMFALQLQLEGAPKAMPPLQQWLRQHPQDLVVRNALGDVQLMAGQLPEARASYEQLLAQAPQAHGVRNNLANVLLRLNDPGALAMAEQALAAQPGNPEVMDTAGWAAFKAGQTERGLKLLLAARDRDGAAPGIRYHLAAVLVASGRRDEARNELSTALQGGRSFHERSEAEALLRSLRAP